MASLQARSPLRSAQPLMFFNKLVSVTAFGILLIGGCLLLCYLKFGPANHWQTGTKDSMNGSNLSVVPAQTDKSSEAAAPRRLVYSCSQDNQYFHSSSHLPRDCRRTALTEDSALQRGLKPCSICFPE